MKRTPPNYVLGFQSNKYVFKIIDHHVTSGKFLNALRCLEDEKGHGLPSSDEMKQILLEKDDPEEFPETNSAFSPINL